MCGCSKPAATASGCRQLLSRVAEVFCLNVAAAVTVDIPRCPLVAWWAERYMRKCTRLPGP